MNQYPPGVYISRAIAQEGPCELERQEARITALQPLPLRVYAVRNRARQRGKTVWHLP